MSTPAENARWSEVKRLFEAAIDLPPSERDAFLDRACRTPTGAPDPELRGAVTALLTADAAAEADATSGFLDAAPLTALLDGLGIEVPEPEATPAGTRIGPYRVLRLLGRGGMGEVYLAERADGLFDRTVALKRVRADLAPGVAARFETERRILAGLVHPGIARLYAAGFDDDGRPWLAMEPVDGVPITEAIRGRSLEERVGLLRQACDAVHHAHRQLVVHRDLKPSNVLVAAGGRVVLLDFGIAQVLGAEEGRRFLTRAYAAPEQLRGEPATTATDVYGLGLLLFEALTGTRPFPTGAARSAPPLASAMAAPAHGGVEAGQLRGDLDAICRKALAPDPADRYASAEALSADLGRALAHEPVLARPASVGYRARQFVRRHRAGVATAALAVVALVAGTVLYTTRLAAERDRAEAAQADAEDTAGFLEGVLGAASPFATDRRDTLRVADLLADAAREVGTMTDTPARQGHLYTVIGRAYRDLGRTAEADSVLRLALPRLDGDPGRWRTAASVLGDVLLKGDSTSIAEAITLYHRVLGDAEARLPPRDPAIANAATSVGVAYWFAQRFEEAVTHTERGLALHRAATPPDSVGLAHSLKAHADALNSAQRLDEAEPLYREMISVRRAVFGPGHPSIAVGLNSFALTLRNAGRGDEALPLAQEALEISRAALGPDHPNTLGHTGTVATLLRGQGQPDEAAVLLETVIERIRAARGPDDSSLPFRYDDLARALIEAERYDEAEGVLRTGMALARQHGGTPSVGGGSFTNKLATLALRRGANADAVRLYRDATREFEAVFGTSENAFSAGALNGYGQALEALGRRADARAAYAASVAAYEAAYGPEHERTVGVRERLASVGGGPDPATSGQ